MRKDFLMDESHKNKFHLCLHCTYIHILCLYKKIEIDMKEYPKSSVLFKIRLLNDKTHF